MIQDKQPNNQSVVDVVVRSRAKKIVRRLILVIGFMASVLVYFTIMNPVEAAFEPFTAYIQTGWYSVDSKPWGTAGSVSLGKGDAHMGKTLVVKEQASNGNYSLIAYNGTDIGWIDTKAIKDLGVHPVSYESTVVKSGYSIDSLPWGTTGYKNAGYSKDYVNQKVQVTSETDTGSFVYIKQGGKNIGWINSEAVAREGNEVRVAKDSPPIDKDVNLAIIPNPIQKRAEVSDNMDPDEATVVYTPGTNGGPGKTAWTINKDKIDATDSLEAKLGVVGTYKGKAIYATVKFSNIKFQNKSITPIITISDSLFQGWWTYIVAQYQLDVSFYYSDGVKANLAKDAYLTFNSLNGKTDQYGKPYFLEYVKYLNADTTSKVYTLEDTLVRYVVNPNDAKTKVWGGSSESFTDYLGGDTFKRATVSFEASGTDHKFILGTDDRNNVWTTLSSATLFGILPETPTKQVVDSSGANINGKNVKVGQEIRYDISQQIQVLGLHILEKYTEFTMTDILPNEADFVRAELVDGSGKVVPNPGTFTYNKTDRSVVFTANETFMSNVMVYNGETYTLRIYTKVKTAPSTSGSTPITFTNKADVVIDTIKQTTNSVNTILPLVDVTIKHLDDDTNALLKTETEKKYDNEAYSYDPRTDLVTQSGDKYKAVTPKQTGTANGNTTVTFRYTKPRTITINHVDKDTGAVLKTSSEKKYDGENYSYAPITTFKNAAGDAYKAVTATQTGTVSGDNITVTLYYTQPRTITVQHIDQETNKVLNTVTEKKHDGLTYSYGVKTDLVYNASFMYKPVTTTAQSGTVAGKDIVLKFYYLSPRTLTINHVDDDDNKVLKSETDRKHNGDTYSYAAKTDLKTSGGDAYKAVTATQTGTVNGNMTITIRYTKPRVITIKHVDDDNDTVLKTETEKKYDGEKYSYAPKTDLKTSSGDAYKAVTATQTGTVDGATTVTIRYIKPRLITIKHVDDDTNAVLATDTDKKYDGTAYSYAVKTTLKTAGGDLYKALSGALTGTVKGDVTLTIRYTKPRVITINHVDDDDGKVIKTESEKKYDGATYSYTPRTDLKTSDNFAYIAKSPIQKGVVDGNTTVTIRYVKPRTITINHVDNDDNKVIKTEIDRKYVGDKYSYSPRTDLKTTGGDAYKGVTAVQTGTIAGHLTITIKYTKPRLLTINHVDDDTEAIIKTETTKQYDGETYTFSAKTDLLFESKYKYYALAPATLSGTVNGNQTLAFRYTKPSLAIGFEKIRIKTDVAANGLPVELNFNLIKLADRWETNSATVTLMDKVTNKTVYTKTVAIKDLKDGLKFTIPAAQLTHKGKHNYEAVVTTSNDKTIVVVTDQNKINTDGYIASGETLSMTSSQKAQELKFEGVAMTERVINKEIKLYNETIVAPVQPSIEVKSGYGFESPQTITYATTVDNDALSDINAIGLADTIISDGNYPDKDGRHQIALSVKNTDVSKKRTTVLDVPQVFVDSEGSVSLTNSPDRVDGKKRLYVEVWPEELGEQTYTVDTEPMGRNAISFELHRKVDIDAYMFNHVDSETMKDDALLITPADHMYFGIDPFIKR